MIDGGEAIGMGRMTGEDLATLYRVGTLGDWADDRLLDRFEGARDAEGEAAFETLVRRHGPMVRRVCRAILGDPHAADDAFQATFLVLAARSGSIRRREGIDGWLHGVALRIARRARRDAGRRRALEGHAARPEVFDPERPDAIDVEALLNEVDRLPGHYRTPILLHDLGGQSCVEVSRRLGCPVGTVKARLSRARSLLRARLERRGHAPSASPIAALPASFALPAPLGERTVRSAVSLAMGRSGAVAPDVAASARWMLNAMIYSQMKTAAAVLLGLEVLSAGALGVIAGQQPKRPEANASTIAASPSIRDGDGDAAAVAAPEPLKGPVPEADAIVDQALEIAMGLDDPTDRAESLLSIGVAQARRGETAEALETLRHAREAAEQIPREAPHPEPHPIIRVATAQAEAGDQEAAFATLKRTASMLTEDRPGPELDWANLLPAWRRVAGRREISLVIEPYRDKLTKLHVGNMPILLAYLEAESGDFDGALRRLRNSEAFRGPGKSRDRLVAAYQVAGALGAGDGGVADRVLSEAKRVIGDASDENSRLSQMHLYALLNVAGVEIRLGRLDDAEATIGAIRPDNLRDDLPERLWFQVDALRFNLARALIELADARREAGDRRGAVETVDAAVGFADQIDIPILRPDLLWKAAACYAELGEFEAAVRYARRGDSGMPPWEAIAEAQRESGDAAGAIASLVRGLEDAEDELDRVRSDLPDAGASDPRFWIWKEDPLVNAAVGVARFRFKLGDLEAATRVIEALPGSSRPWGFITLSADLARIGNIEEARAVIGGIDDPGMRERAIVEIAIAWPGPRPAPERNDGP